MAPPLTPIGLCLPCLGHESYLASLVSTASVAASFILHLDSVFPRRPAEFIPYYSGTRIWLF